MEGEGVGAANIAIGAQRVGVDVVGLRYRAGDVDHFHAGEGGDAAACVRSSAVGELTGSRIRDEGAGTSGRGRTAEDDVCTLDGCDGGAGRDARSIDVHTQGEARGVPNAHGGGARSQIDRASSREACQRHHGLEAGVLAPKGAIHRVVTHEGIVGLVNDPGG